ncbi:MAG TPA: carbonic anhydrase [Candidatus Hydrogenedentes bacterium]|nr:carbonic anhydrase [Candidatus Hydrogenedentota bacterium]
MNAKKNKMFGLGVWVGITAFLIGCMGASGAADPKPSPDQIIEMLKAGNARFVSGAATHPHSDAARLALAGKENQGDYAIATVLACSDSRVPVERIFDVGVMDIFVVRVPGNVCNVDEIGSIEYGLAHVKTPVLVILGHTQCGAVTAVTHAAEGKGHALERNIPPLIAGIRPALDRSIAKHPDVHGDDIIPYAIEENIWQAVENLFFASPATRSLVHDGKVKVIGAMYDVATGQVRWLEESKITDILTRVEANPNRPMDPMAEEKHDHGSSAKPHAAEEK